MPRPENHEKPQLPVPCCAIRAENLQLLMPGAPSAENLAAPMRPPGDRAWGRRAVFRVGITSAVTGNVCPVPRAAMSSAASGGRTVEPVTEEDF